MARIQIVDGPDRFELAAAFFQGRNEKRTPVRFVVEEEHNMEQIAVVVNALRRTDESDNAWNFEGYLYGGTLKVEGYYSTKLESGFLDR